MLDRSGSLGHYWSGGAVLQACRVSVRPGLAVWELDSLWGLTYANFVLRARSSAAERSAHNRLVVGSNPAEPTKSPLYVPNNPASHLKRALWSNCNGCYVVQEVKEGRKERC